MAKLDCWTIFFVVLLLFKVRLGLFSHYRGYGGFRRFGRTKKKNVRLPNLLRKRNVQPSTKKRACQGRAVPLTNEFCL